ncbi:superinfection immunity protein [Gluconobacter kanchanaburiensis]|nr:superinfection immunity protein [Gluconobacter kanchanaburiensis]MBF0862617.1 superinfection immunity protein [Gluconobacter kanchanaburiensis]
MMNNLKNTLPAALLLAVLSSGLAYARPAAPIAHAILENSAHASLSAQGVSAALDIRKVAKCDIPIVWTDADSSPASPCHMAFLTLRAPGYPRSPTVSFPLSPYGADEGMTQLKMSFRKLDASSALPQVLVSAYTGGAHCCSLTSIFDLRPDGRWAHLELGAMDGDGEPDIEDIAGDGQQEILTADQSFLYAFASHAGSEAPVVISRYHDGELENVTRDPVYRTYLKDDLARRRRVWVKGGRFEPNGFLAYEVATRANIGDFSDGWRDMLAHAQSTEASGFGLSACDLKPAAEKQNGHGCSPAEKKPLPFPQALAAFLVQTGYITAEQARSVTEPQKQTADSRATAPAPMKDGPAPTNAPLPSSAAARPAENSEAVSASGLFAKSGTLFPLLASLALLVYLVPLLIAYRRHTANQHRIAMITILLGWTGVGWIIALIMALSQPSSRKG